MLKPSKVSLAGVKPLLKELTMTEVANGGLSNTIPGKIIAEQSQDGVGTDRMAEQDILIAVVE